MFTPAGCGRNERKYLQWMSLASRDGLTPGPRDKGLQSNRNVQFPSQAIPRGWSIANMLVFNKVQESLGFQWCAHLITGSVPITQEVLEHFMLVNLPVLEWVSVLIHTFSMSLGSEELGVLVSRCLESKWRLMTVMRRERERWVESRTLCHVMTRCL